MDEVATDLFVGTVNAVGKESLLRNHGITTVVSLTHGNSFGGSLPAETDVANHPIIDGPQADLDTFEQAVDDVVAALQSGERVFVCCSAGASRSPAVAATALALVSETDLDNAFQQVSDRRQAVDPHEALIRHAARVYLERRR
jgi:protein-tyrosine phosphatase